MANQFVNPANGYVEKISGWSWVWSLLFGPLFYLKRGVWRHALLGFLVWPMGVAFWLGILTIFASLLPGWPAPKSWERHFVDLFYLMPFGIAAGVYAARAPAILRAHYGRAGWKPTIDRAALSTQRVQPTL